MKPVIADFFHARRRSSFLATILLVCLGVPAVAAPSEHAIAAFRTHESTVSDNIFVASQHTSLGVYRTAVRAADDSSGTHELVPGERANVETRWLPADAEAVTHRFDAGESLVHTVALPAFLRIDDDAANQWETSQSSDGSWTARHVQRFDADATETYTESDVVTLPIIVASRPWDASVAVSVELPERLTSTHPEDEARIAASSGTVKYGAYDLKVRPDKGGEAFAAVESGVLSFNTLPDTRPEIVGFRSGDVTSHTVHFPQGLSPVKVPADEVLDDAIVSWALQPEGSLTRSVTFTEDTPIIHPQTVVIPVVTGLNFGTGGIAAVTSTVPTDLTSAHPSETAHVLGFVIDMSTASAGYYFSAALAADGSAFTWGAGSSGQLGNGANIQSDYPVRVDTDQ